MSFQKVFLVTGGSGFLASRLVPLLHAEIPDCKIIVVSRKENTIWRNYPHIQLICGDLRKPAVWSELPLDITNVFYLAAVIPWKDKDKSKAAIATNNLQPLSYMIDYSRRWPELNHVIFSSSISVYAKTGLFLNEASPTIPSDIYGASKLAGENLLLCLESRGVKVSSLRYSSLYGYGQYQGTVLPTMVSRAIRNQDIIVYGTGERAQDFLHCEDAARANIIAYGKKAQGIFNIGSGIPVTMAKLAKTINNVFANGRSRIIYLTEKEDHDPGFRLDISKARQQLNYQPLIQIESGLQKLKNNMEVNTAK